ncbi:MAG: hypothetical protein JWM59_1277 [Verrucomicrobiales bacterium]|nr:hypothetical protein [Verrucomicrobiales bacterium]
MNPTRDDLLKAMPESGLFAGKEWLTSPEPFPIPAPLMAEMNKLGHRLHVFQKACNDLYYRSLKGKAAPWIAEYLDAGKPPELLDAARAKPLRNALPGVIRPDLILTESGFALAEIDSVPGGIGLTAWLGRTYAALHPGKMPVGGADGMIDGFRSIFPHGGDVVISQESAGYRPEMEWLAAQCGPSFAVREAEHYQSLDGRDVYRFFELFDLPRIPGWQALQQAAAEGRLTLSAPMKPWLEEKLWLALFWSRPLRALWRQELRENQRDALAKIIPRGWVVDPAPLPHHAVLPGLDINAWDELAGFSQKERQLVLKRSGFHEDAWGSRSVVIGHDVSQPEWADSVRLAQESFAESPWVLQQFQTARVVEHPYFDRTTGGVRIMQGRVRLCPYYFVPRDGSPIQLGGVLATIVPADKKILHGMTDSILVPACAAPE